MVSLLTDRQIIKISGEDAPKYLQNLITNDVSLCKDNNPIYAMMLSPTGRFLFDMFIIKQAEEYFLDIFSGTKDLLLKKLNLYKINLKVTIDDISEQYRVGYKRDAEPEFCTNNSLLFYYKDPRSEKLGYRFAYPGGLSLGDSPVEYLNDKYEYGIPDGGIDLLYDKAMPQEYGAEELNAISYTKGCYIGQEVISRTKYQGQVRKKIYKITSLSDLGLIQHGCEITSDGKKIGIFCSGYLNKALALIRSEDLEASSGKCFIEDVEVFVQK